ncbi:hypothetical protein BDF21DRAFT_447745 [Thamnidium elegans]|nr:hypothetical protein BDF21DRAFT_447745 [Thamnidium elegans]
MIPRLPPLILAAIGGASIYGIKYAMDRFETKAIGSGQDFEKVLKYRQKVKRVGIAAAVSGVILAGCFLSDINKQEKESNEFYQDQYATREKKLAQQKFALDEERREKEVLAGQQLKQEVIAMETLLGN